jgi:hypothetical protein
MSTMFDSIENAREYVGLLLDAIIESASEIDDLRRTSGAASPVRRDALLLIAYKIEQLRVHVDASHRGLTDLRALQRVLEHEPAVA